MDSATLGKIVLAKFLTLPLKAYDRYVTEIESSLHFQALRPWMEASSLDNAVIRGVPDDNPTSSSKTLGEVRATRDRPYFVYHNPSAVREYRFDEDELKRLRLEDALPRELAGTLHRLHLINSRNRLTHAITQGLLNVQAPFLITGDPLALVSLSQARMSRILTEHANLPLVADTGRLSRLIRGLSFKMMDGRTLPLSVLFPRERQIHCHRIDSLIKREKTLLVEGHIAHPLPDDAIAELLQLHYGVSLSRRSVALVRHQLAIPDWRCRGDRKDYLVATEGFSPLLPLTLQGLLTSVPPHSGVYEIRSAATPENQNPADNAPSSDRARVVYIGSTRDLRKRLSDHLRGNNGNVRLCNYLAEGGARVRFRAVREGWRLVERDLYRVFCETFGSPPPCNRMSP